MHTPTVTNRVRLWLPQVTGVGHRFPLALAACILLAGYLLLEFHHGTRPGGLGVRIPLGLAATFGWGLAAALFAESRTLPSARGYVVGLSGAVVLAVLVFIGPSQDLNWGLLIAALALSIGLAAQSGHEPRNGAFWLFNHQLWIGYATSLVGAVLFGGGISAILGSLQYLFALKIPFWMHEKVWVVALTLVGPIYWMSLIPRDLDAAVTEGEQSEFTSRSIAVLVRYILVPMLLAYGAMLHVYAIKIGIEQSLPKGRLGSLTVSYGAALAATALASWPTRHTGGPLVALFWRTWPWLLLVPVLLLAVAIGVRIQTYGLTPQRYLIALAGVWLAVVGVATGVRGQKADLRLIPASLALLVALASFGPWGMAGWSVRNQVSGLVTHLEAAGLVRDGKVVDPAPPRPALASDRGRIAGAIDYIDRAGRLDLIAPLFSGAPRNPFEAATPMPGRSDTKLRDAVRERLGVAGLAGSTGGRRHWGHYAREPGVFPIHNGGEIVGQFQATQRAGKRRVFTVKPSGGFTTELDGMNLSVSDADGRTVRFDLSSLTAPDGPLTQLVSGAAGTYDRSRPPLAIRTNIDGAEHTLLIINVSATREHADAPIVISSMSFWLVRPRLN